MARRYDLVVVGMGSAGIVAAEFAAELGLRVAAVEEHRIGGDCLWTGCVPSKALIASATVAHRMRTADRYGLPAVEPEIDTGAVWHRIRDVQEQIASTDDDPERFEAMGVEVVRGRARLTGRNSVEVDGRRLETRFVLLCTGSRPAVPPADGLAEAGFLTTETIWRLERPPESLIVVGGGPIGCELAQACRRLGIGVSLIEALPRLLPRDEPELAELLESMLRAEGVEVGLGSPVERVAVEGSRKAVYTSEARWEADELLVAVGRQPNVEGMGLEEAGVRMSATGIEVDGRLRTSVSSIYAVGDVAGRYLFTHSAAYEAAQALRDMFFPGKGDGRGLIPWCTFTDPELARCGLTLAEAGEEHGAARVRAWRLDLTHVDRARADGAAGGRLVLVTAGGRLVGAHVLAPAAGELIHELARAVRQKTKLRDLAGLVHVYPTYSTAVHQLAAKAAYERARRLRWLMRIA